MVVGLGLPNRLVRDDEDDATYGVEALTSKVWGYESR